MAMNIKISDERGAQLQLIAEAEGKTVVDAITDMIRDKVAAGVISPDLPGFSVTKTAAGMAVAAPGFAVTVPEGEVKNLTEALRAVAEKVPPSEVERKQAVLETIAGLGGVTIKRMARGVKLISPVTGREYPITFGVGLDLADQIDRAA